MGVEVESVVQKKGKVAVAVEEEVLGMIGAMEAEEEEAAVEGG